jgi:hypothetical protein
MSTTRRELVDCEQQPAALVAVLPAPNRFPSLLPSRARAERVQRNDRLAGKVEPQAAVEREAGGGPASPGAKC